MKELLKISTDVIIESKNMVFFFRKLDYRAGLLHYLKVIDNIMKYLEQNNAANEKLKIPFEQSKLYRCLSKLEGCMEQKDYVLLSDVVGGELIHYFEMVNEYIFSNSKVNDLFFESERDYINWTADKKQLVGDSELMKKYEVEPTSDGLITLKYEDKYLVSNYPVDQAIELASEWMKDCKMSYIVCGLGMGYHIKQMLVIDDNVTIDVYEASKAILCISEKYGCYRELVESARVNIIYDEDYKKLWSRIKNIEVTTGFVVYEPELVTIENVDTRDRLEDYFINYSSIRNQGRNLYYCFNKNMELGSKPVDCIGTNIEGKDVYIIGAGPSLDKNIMELKNVGENGVIISTGTVFRKLLRAGIKPNYVIITDSNSGVYRQIDGLEASDVPLLYMSTAYYRIPQEYKGDKYIIYQKGYNLSEQRAKKMSGKMYNTGGSVTTTAFDLAIQLGAKRIIGVGIDMAYTDGYDHAKDTPLVKEVGGQAGAKLVDGIDGGKVRTSNNLDIYRKWIERRIATVDSVEFINATEGGALIKGMKNKKLKDVIKN